MNTMHICICCGFCKHGWILLKLGMQVSIGHGEIGNENGVNGELKKNHNLFFLGEKILC